MKILLVDDETLARDRLKRLLENEDQHAIVGEAANGIDAVQECVRLQPDMVLLDIRMPGMDGLETARHILELDSPPAVIFCTAYEEHAIQAFDLQAVGYLLKPVRRKNLLAALDNSIKLNRAQINALRVNEQSSRSHISARTHKGVELIAIDDVRYLQADQKYVSVRYGGGEVIIDETLKDLEDEFGARFMRIHRSALVGKDFIDGLVKDEQGRMCIRLRGVDELIEVSRRHLSAVRKLLKSL